MMKQLKYKDQLDTFSKSILCLGRNDASISRVLAALLVSDSSDNINVYRNNLLEGLFARFSDIFPGTINYLEETNFRFFLKLFIYEGRVESHSFPQVAIFFLQFLREKEDLHQDQFILGIAKLDIFWSTSNIDGSTIELPTGITALWQKLLEGKTVEEQPIDFETIETVVLQFSEREKSLTYK